MALQLGNFQAMRPQHITLAETQKEKDAALARQMKLQAVQNAGGNARAALNEQGAIIRQNAGLADAQDERSLNQENLLRQEGIKQNQQAFQNNMDERKMNLAEVEADREGRNQNIAMQDRAYNLGRARVKDQREDSAYNSAKSINDRQLALAQFGDHLLMLEPDEQGSVDVTGQKANIKTMLGGFDKDYKKITAQNVKGKTQLFGWDGDKATPLTIGGSQIAIPNQVLQMAAMFAKGGKQAEDKGFELTEKNDSGLQTSARIYPSTGAVYSLKDGKVEMSNLNGVNPELAAIAEALKKSRQPAQQPSLARAEQKQNIAEPKQIAPEAYQQPLLTREQILAMPDGPQKRNALIALDAAMRKQKEDEAWQQRMEQARARRLQFGENLTNAIGTGLNSYARSLGNVIEE